MGASNRGSGGVNPASFHGAGGHQPLAAAGADNRGGGLPSQGGFTAPPAATQGHMPGGGGTISPGMPGVQGGGMSMSPAGLGQGAQPNLAQSFTSGFATGQATGPGGQALSGGPLNAFDGGAPQTPPATPAVTPTVPSAGAFIAATPPVDAAPAPMTTGGATPVAPAVMTGGRGPHRRCQWAGRRSLQDRCPPTVPTYAHPSSHRRPCRPPRPVRSQARR